MCKREARHEERSRGSLQLVGCKVNLRNNKVIEKEEKHRHRTKLLTVLHSPVLSWLILPVGFLLTPTKKVAKRYWPI